MRISKKIAFFALSFACLCSMDVSIAAPTAQPEQQTIGCRFCSDEENKQNPTDCGCGKKKKKNSFTQLAAHSILNPL
jgi:hypothetical protein